MNYLIAVALLVSGLDESSTDFAAPNTEKEAGQPLPPAEAADGLTVPEGFRVDVFAAEPDVMNPIAMAWDDRGRMWVAENHTYAERSQRFDLSLRDRLLVFEDHDGDGRADDRRIFSDQLQMLTSVEVGRGGVWLMCPPQLLFIPDADADCRPDGPAQVVLDGFTVGRDNYHNFANGLRWGPDGWLYGRCGHSCPGRLGVPGTPDELRVPMWGGIWRFHPERKIVEVICHGTVNPWGHDWDRNGELFFINTVIGHVWHAMPGAHFRESHGETRNPFVYERMDMVGDHYHFQTGRDKSGTKHQTTDELGGGHAHIGMSICLSQHWPDEYRNRLFTINMHGQRLNVDRLSREGAGYVARHQPDFCRSRDPFFRGLDARFGPDGDLYVLDWSDIGECHEHTGVHRTSGRIFRISYGEPSRTSAVHKPPCMGQEGRLAQLWQRYQSGTVSRRELRQLLHHRDEHLRVWAIRLLTDFWPLDTVAGPPPNAVYPDDPATMSELHRLAEHDESGLVHLVLASTLQRLPPHERIELARTLLSRDEHCRDRDLPYLIWYGLIPSAKSDPHAVAGLAAHCRYPQTLKWMTRFAASRLKEDVTELDRILLAATGMSPDLQSSVVAGIQDGVKGWRTAPQPAHWTAFAASVRDQGHADAARNLNVIFGDGVALQEIRAIAMSSRAPLHERISALETLIRNRPDDLRGICENLLRTRTLNLTAAKGLATFQDPQVGKLLASSYRRFHVRDRPALLELLVSRVDFAMALLDEVGREGGSIPLGDISASHARQIQNLESPQCNERLSAVWGKLRPTSAERLQRISELRDSISQVEVTHARLQQGRQLFLKTCAQCHKLYGEGKAVGPDLTGSQRSHPDYLLQNIIDPSAVVGPQYRMSIVVLRNGRVVNGLVVEENPETIVLQTPTSSEVISRQDIETQRLTTESAMPDGLLNSLSTEEVDSLLVYLMYPTQIVVSTETGE